jgi:hypothetical protein
MADADTDRTHTEENPQSDLDKLVQRYISGEITQAQYHQEKQQYMPYEKGFLELAKQNLNPFRRR